VPLYSDLLLHDMGPFLDDGVVQGSARGQDWRTAPLWGIGQRQRFLHDGRARTIEAAIGEHGGEADGTVRRFRALTTSERTALLAFISSLWPGSRICQPLPVAVLVRGVHLIPMASRRDNRRGGRYRAPIRTRSAVEVPGIQRGEMCVAAIRSSAFRVVAGADLISISYFFPFGEWPVPALPNVNKPHNVGMPPKICRRDNPRACQQSDGPFGGPNDRPLPQVFIKKACKFAYSVTRPSWSSTGTRWWCECQGGLGAAFARLSDAWVFHIDRHRFAACGRRADLAYEKASWAHRRAV